MKNPVRQALKEGQPHVGSWLSLACPLAGRVLARTGFRWLTVDVEHSPVNWETAATLFGHIADAGCVPLARVPCNSHDHIKRALDNGAHGIVVPMVNTAEEAAAAVSAAKYHPEGTRSVGGSLHALNFGISPAEYYREANDNILVVIQTEHIESVRNAEEIFQVPGIDAMFVGPNDLHSSMGLAPAMESDEPEFVEAMNTLLATAKKHGVAPGLHVGSTEAAARRIAEGWQFIAVGSDLAFMLSTAKQVTADLSLEARGETARY